MTDLVAAGFVLLRTPLLPFAAWHHWADGLVPPQPGADLASLESELERQRGILRSRLRSLLDSRFEEALFLSSPRLHRAVTKWLRDPHDRRSRSVEVSLASFLARLAGRSTPFGLCAGVTLGEVGDETVLELSPAERYRRRTRLDTRCLLRLTDRLARDPELRQVLLYRPNPTLHPAAGELRYVQVLTSAGDEEVRRYEVVVCTPTPILEATLARAADGATRADLAHALLEPGDDLADAQEFVDELIDAQILVTELEPPQTGPEPAAALVRQLRDLAPARPFADRLGAGLAALDEIDRQGVGAPVDCYPDLRRELADAGIDAGEWPLFQADLLKPPARVRVDGRVIDEVVRGIGILQRLARPLESFWQRLPAAFQERYGEREVPLLEALDGELGLALAPERDTDPDLRKAVADPRPPGQAVTWTRRDVELMKRVARALAAGEMEVRLDSRDVDAIGCRETGPLLTSFSALATVLAASAEEVSQGRFRVFLNGLGPSASLLGRFCHLDGELQEKVTGLLAREEALATGRVFAEVVHQPGAERHGNVLYRSFVGGHEIVYLGRSGAPAERQIPLSDLFVSLRHGRIALRSRSLDKEIVPRLSNAHSCHGAGNPPVYRFLAGLPQQSLTELPQWEWGPVFSSLPFLPRLAYGRLVLSPASWLFEKEHLVQLGDAFSGSCWNLVQAWRLDRRLPRLVALREGDRRLPVDLDNPLSVASLVQRMRAWDWAILEELLPGPDELCASGPEGLFCHEMIVPLLRGTPQPEPGTSAPAGPALASARTFPPGSEWVYAKLYASGSLADRLLMEVVQPLAADLLGTGLADRWFFIRYADPEPHLRVRFHTRPGSAAQVLAALHEWCAPALADGRTWKLQLDTYEREVERYGGNEGMELAEEVFHADSEAVVALLAAQGRKGLWRLGLAGADALLTDLGFDLAGRRDLALRLRDGYRAELRADPAFVHRTGEMFRSERPRLKSILEGPQPFAARSLRLAPAADALRRLERAGRLGRTLPEIAASLVHMHLNRLLRGDLRAQEAVLYDFLFRFYDSLRFRRSGLCAAARSAAAR